MRERINRRGFLASSLAAAMVPSVAPVVGTPASCSAIEPISRSQGPRFKFSLAAYSYRNLLQGAGATMSLADFVTDCAAFGLEATELTSYYFPDPVTTEFLADLRRTCFHLGLDVSGTAVRNDFALPPGADRDHWLAHVKEWVDHSAILGAPVIRVFAGHVPSDASAEEAHRLIVAGFEECCEYAGGRGIHLALENHGGPTATVDGLLAIVRDVKSRWFGVNLDTGNFSGDDIYGDLARAAPYALNVQVKVAVTEGSGKKGPMDFARVARILREANYRGYVVLEYEEGGDPREECKKYLDAIRHALR